MPRMALVGPSYASQSPNLDAEVCMNLYVESDDGGSGNAPLAMYSTPGTKVFVQLETGDSFGAGGTFDKVIVNSSGVTTSPATSSGAPSTADEIAILLSVCGANSTIGSAASPWAFLGSPDGGEATLYAQSLTSIATINSSQTVSAATNWLTMLMFFGAKVAGGNAAVVQEKTLGSGGLTPGAYAGTFAATPVAGNGVLVTLAAGITSTHLLSSITCVDSLGRTYTPIGGIVNAGGVDGGGLNTPTAAAFWLQDSQGLNPTVTVTTAAANLSGAIEMREISGIGPILSSNGPVRGELEINGRGFAVSGPGFFEILANGTSFNWGSVENDSLPVTMAASPQQLLLASAGTAYIFDLTANTLTPIAGSTFDGPVSQAAICDDFFLLTIQDSKEFYVSAPLDATDWVTNGSTIVTVFPDNIVSMIVFQRQVWFFSDTQSVVYYDSGNVFPFDVNPNAFIEAGSGAENSPVIFNNSIAWLGADSRGAGKVWLANGYTPTRISNHAIEFAIQSYSKISDAVGFSYQDQGHEFYVLYFPTPSVTWTYDAMTGMWHQRGYFVESIGQFRAAHYQNHMFLFGMHLVGDWQSGDVYQMAIPSSNGSGGWNFVTDAGNPIRRVRRAPHISREQKRQYHTEIQIYLEAGLGPTPPLVDGGGNARDPQLMLSWSDDGGHSFGNEFILNCGQAGKFTVRARKLQLGRARDRVYQIAMSDPIPWRVIDGYLQILPGTGI